MIFLTINYQRGTIDKNLWYFRIHFHACLFVRLSPRLILATTALKLRYIIHIQIVIIFFNNLSYSPFLQISLRCLFDSIILSTTFNLGFWNDGITIVSTHVTVLSILLNKIQSMFVCFERLDGFWWFFFLFAHYGSWWGHSHLWFLISGFIN